MLCKRARVCCACTSAALPCRTRPAWLFVRSVLKRIRSSKWISDPQFWQDRPDSEFLARFAPVAAEDARARAAAAAGGRRPRSVRRYGPEQIIFHEICLILFWEREREREREKEGEGEEGKREQPIEATQKEKRRKRRCYKLAQD
mgnify:CR=1 FL=1